MHDATRGPGRRHEHRRRPIDPAYAKAWPLGMPGPVADRRGHHQPASVRQPRRGRPDAELLGLHLADGDRSEYAGDLPDVEAAVGHDHDRGRWLHCPPGQADLGPAGDRHGVSRQWMRPWPWTHRVGAPALPGATTRTEQTRPSTPIGLHQRERGDDRYADARVGKCSVQQRVPPCHRRLRHTSSCPSHSLRPSSTDRVRGDVDDVPASQDPWWDWRVSGQSSGRVLLRYAAARSGMPRLYEPSRSSSALCLRARLTRGRRSRAGVTIRSTPNPE